MFFSPVFICEDYSLRGLFLQQFQKVFAELRHLGRYHEGAVACARIAREVFLMIIFGNVEILDWFNLRNDGAVPDFLGI